MFKKVLLGFCISFNGFACGGGQLPSFGADNYPDLPLNHFVAGNLGIMSPKLASSYLVVAYRYLNQLPLSKMEQENALSVWGRYARHGNYGIEPVYPLDEPRRRACAVPSEQSQEKSNPQQIIKDYVHQNHDYFAWRKARLRALGLATALPRPQLARKSTDWSYVVSNFYSTRALEEDNIDELYSIEPGFNYLVLATQRLQAIKAALDEEGKALNMTLAEEKDLLSLWISAQQQLFKKNKVGAAKARALLATLPDKLLPLMKADVQYTLAASYLYEGTAEGALNAAQGFEQLVNNQAYPWHEWVRYLHYRALNIAVNHLSQQSDGDSVCAEHTPCRAFSEQAYQGMLALANTAELDAVKEAAADYLNIINTQTKWRVPQTYEKLVQASFKELSYANFFDMILLSNRLTNQVVEEDGNELSLWLNTVLAIRPVDDKDYRSLEPQAFNRAYKSWQANPKNLAWLWLAVYTIEHATPSQQQELIAATLNLTRGEPAFVPVRLALIERFSLLKEPTIALLPLINETLAGLGVGEDFSATRGLLNQRVKAASSLNDFIEHAFFYPSDNLLACAALIDPDKQLIRYSSNYIVESAATIINALPASVLMQMATQPNFPENYRPALYANLWVRSILFKDKDLEQRVAKQAMNYNPVLRATIKQMAKTRVPDERETLFLSALLHYPNLSPIIDLKLYRTWRVTDEYLSVPNSIVLRQESLDSSYNHWLWTQCSVCDESAAPAFLSAGQQDAYQEQLRRLNDLATATTYLSDSLIRLANRHPEDVRYAELLALFIKYTRYANGGSKQAFITLKKRYPHSTWAKNTKYYY